MDKEQLKNPPGKYRPIPFWSWNDKLEEGELRRQVRLMGDAGMGGFFMHARGGLSTEYMSEEWFHCVDASVEEADSCGMKAWAYDENGWPSGFGNGLVNGKGLKYQQKYLRMEQGERQTEHTICNKGGWHFYYEVNPFYVDTLDAEVIADFLKEIYQPYYERFGSRIAGFFTDEPQISRNGIPWSLTMPGKYEEEYGENLLDHLEELFHPLPGYEKTRLQFWRLVTKLFNRNFAKQIYDWCDERGLRLTGHYVLEETLESQLTCNGAVMPHYEYLHIPGMDWLGRNIFPCLTMHQLASACRQTGKKQILTESFALCGHNVSFSELKGIAEWQMVRGITTLCQHLQGYTLRGIRKRDYPPAVYYQQPWWKDYRAFVDAMSRIGMILTEGECRPDILLMHPQTSAWICYDGGSNEGMEALEKGILDAIRQLEEKHLQFDLGDETLMEKHGKVEDGRLYVGQQSYSTVILPPHIRFFDSTNKLLEEFAASGGTVIGAEEICDLKADTSADNPNVTYTYRRTEDALYHYVVNSTDQEQRVVFNRGDRILDIQTGETYEFTPVHDLLPFESVMVVEDIKKEKEPISLDGGWEIVSLSENALTLDICDYYFDGELEEKDGYVLNIQNRACEKKRPINIRQVYRVQIKDVPKKLTLVMETPEFYDIRINGQNVLKKDEGHYMDTAFRRLDITPYITAGVNEIELVMDYFQSPEVYDNLEKSKQFESEKNKLCYDREMEPMYLVGDFSVETDGEYTVLDKHAVRYQGGFAIAQRRAEITLSHMEQQGLPFFAGEIVLKKEFDLEETNLRLKQENYGWNTVRVSINGQEPVRFLWGRKDMDISSLLKPGKNTVELTLINNLRNLMGPHHLEEGESYLVSPVSFYKEECIWKPFEGGWNDGYCFAEMTVK